MNDPHVVALIYRIEHRPNVSYERAVPLDYGGEHFRVRIEDCRARFQMRNHCATAEDARDVVEPLIRAWEIDAGLRHSPGEIQFVFETVEIVDRNPTTSGVVVHVPTAQLTIQGYPPTVHMTRGDYPQPPTDLAVNSDVEVMYFRYGLYREGMDTLAAMANFCLTVLEASAKGGQRSAAAKKYAIAPEVLSQLGRLVSEKGGREARKAKGTTNEFTTTEKR